MEHPARYGTMRVRDWLKRLMLQSGVGRSLYDQYQHRLVDCYVMSYPKCGRTWLRVMLAKTFAIHFGYSGKEMVHEPKDMLRACGETKPWLSFLHGYRNSFGYPPDPHIEESERQFAWYRRKRVVLLTRDPRDVIVSYFLHRTRRLHEVHEFSDFVRHPWWGIDRILLFMRGWYDHRHIPSAFHMVRYEDLHQDTTGELRKVLDFIGLEVAEAVIGTAVAYGAFDNMRTMSLQSDVPRLAPADPRDIQSYKVRKGKVGEYGAYLSSEDRAYINAKIRCTLPLHFGYTKT